jgi:hypothetical protein
MTRPKTYISLLIGSDTRKITDIISMLPQDFSNTKYYDIGELREQDNEPYPTSYYRYKYMDNNAFDASTYLINFLNKIKIDTLKKIVSLQFRVLFVYYVDMDLDINILEHIELPDTGLNAELMRQLGNAGIDYQVSMHIS